MSAVKAQTLQVHHTYQFMVLKNADIFKLYVIGHGLLKRLNIPALQMVVFRQYTSPCSGYVSETVGALKADLVFNRKFVKQVSAGCVFCAIGYLTSPQTN